jgi:hypothetical protein
VLLRRFHDNARGSIAVVAALSVMAIGAAVGAALDYTRIASARTAMQAAVDAAALRAGKSIMTGVAMDATQRTLSARKMFDAIFERAGNPEPSEFSVSESDDYLKIRAAADVSTHFGALIGKSKVRITAAADVPVGVSTLEVALVLDNTGSMAAFSKMSELKAASNLFLDIVDSARQSGALGTVQIGVAPFNTEVDVGTGHRFASFLRFDGAGSAERMLAVDQASWTGCVADRDKPYDVDLAAPAFAVAASRFPAARCQYSSLSRVQPLTTDFSTLRAAINGMTPTGMTNTAIGMAWGYNLLTRGMPLGDAAFPLTAKRNSKVMIFLTDGVNTADRFSRNPADIDARMAKLCAAAKLQKIEIYTVRVIEGNESLLRDCATAPDYYFNITKSSDLAAAFRKIAERLVTLRLSS